MVIVEGCCTMARSSSFRSKLFIGWHKKYSEFWLVRYNGLVWSNIAVPALLPFYIHYPCFHYNQASSKHVENSFERLTVNGFKLRFVWKVFMIVIWCFQLCSVREKASCYTTILVLCHFGSCRVFITSYGKT